MSSATHLGSDRVRRLEELCDRFEAELKRGESPQIEVYLESADDRLRKELLRELIALERHYVGTLQESSSADDYAARFPDDCDIVDSVFRVGDTRVTVQLDETVTEAPSARRMPQEFGNYVLLEVLGKGGMGVVYKARQKNPDRLVALKMIRAGGFATGEQIQRFQAETAAVARLDHRNIVPIYEAGEHEGRYFYSMAFIEGANLDTNLRDRPLQSHKAARLVRTLAEAVEHAHERGIIHRDLKPANVLMSRSDVKGKVAPKITDFGLAKLTETDSEMTASGQVMGTPSYMPPEQAAGRMAEVGPPSDVYSLGAILYALLTGRPPFHAAALAETLQQVIYADPVAPRQLNPAVDRDLETICLKCLEKSPDRRYQTAADLAEDLGRYIKGEPVQARPIGRAGRVVRWAKRNPVIASLASLSVLLLIGGAGVSTYFGITATRAAESEKTAREEAEDATKAEKRAKEDADTKRRAADAAATRARNAEAKSARERKLAQWEAYKARLFPIREAWEKQEFGHLKRLLQKYKPKPGEPDFRGWEWYFFEDEVRRRFTTIKPQASRFTYVQWSPDGKHLAFRRADGAIEIRDGRNYKLRHTLTGRKQQQMTWHPNSRLLAAAAGDRHVEIWDIEQAKIIQTLSTPGTDRTTMTDRALAWSRDGTRLALGGTARIDLWRWNGEARFEKTLRSFRTFINAIDWHPDGKQLAAGGASLAGLLDTTRDRIVWHRRGYRIPVFDVKWSPDGKQVAVSWGWPRSMVRVYELTGIAKQDILFPQTTGPMRAIAWMPGGESVVSINRDQAIYFWDVRNKSMQRSLRLHSSALWSFDLQPDRLLGVSVDNTGSANIWSAKPAPTVSTEITLPGRGEKVEWHQRIPDLIATGDENSVFVCDTNKREVVHTIRPTSGREFGGISWHPAKPWLALQSRHTGWVTVHDVISKTDVFKVRSSSGDFSRHVRWSPDGKYLAAGSGRKWFRDSIGDIDVWDVESRKRICRPGRKKRRRTCIAWSPDSRYLAVGAFTDSFVEVWDITTSKLVWRTDAQSNIYHIHWSSDGGLVAAASDSGWVSLLNARNGKPVSRLDGHQGFVRGISWSPDGQRILTSSPDRTMRLWDAATGDFLIVFGPDPPVGRYAFWDPTGRRIATCADEQPLLQFWGTKNLKVPAKIDRIEDGVLMRSSKHR